MYKQSLNCTPQSTMWAAEMFSMIITEATFVLLHGVPASLYIFPHQDNKDFLLD
jgi:hypothetical protein